MGAGMKVHGRQPAGPSRQRGFTIVEIAVALTVLAAGSAVLWYGIRASARMDKLNREHHAALMLARSDLESLRGMAKQDVHDTAYLGQGAGAESLLVVRRVLDSARIVNSPSEVELDEKMSPKDLRKPLEVRVRVYRAPMANGGGFSDPGDFQEPAAPSFFGSSEENAETGPPRPLAALTAKLPEYKWW
jgi:prepilin-type N-terminal cleavage/methylation domain-containing protein